MKLLIEVSRPGARGYLPCPGPREPIPDPYRRVHAPLLPEVTENEIVRHLTRLSRVNFSVDGNFYPLGSCTMKYNPRFHAEAVRAFARVHPLALRADEGFPAADPPAPPASLLDLLHRLERGLSHLVGMDAFSLAPAAGAQGELAGVLILRAHFRARGEDRRTLLIPDSAHGTNPASAALAGFAARTVASGSDGGVDLADLERKMDDGTAGLMLTNPSTLGLFERRVERIAEIVHGRGGLLYYDGANLNAIVGRFAPGRMGFDVCHLNLHKTFAVPHGGGGPGAGPIGVKEFLAPYLPVPMIARRGDRIFLEEAAARPRSIGRLHAFHGNVLALVRAWCYLAEVGGAGLAEASGAAVLAANYLKVRLAASGLESTFASPHPARRVGHEVLLTADRLHRAGGPNALDVAKNLLDADIHAPTVYFPLTVPEALLIEPTETESLATLDRFVEKMKNIARLSSADAHAAPRSTPVARPDEARAARAPVLRWRPKTDP